MNLYYLLRVCAGGALITAIIVAFAGDLSSALGFAVVFALLMGITESV